MFRCLTIWLSVLFTFALHLPLARAVPGLTGCVWFEREGNADSKKQWIREHPISAEGIARIAALKGVTDLDIGFFPDVVEIDGKALAGIGKIEGLRGLTFYITGVNLKEKDWAFLAKLTEMDSLWVYGEELDLGDDFLQFVSELKALKELVIFPRGKFSDEGVAKLASLQNLTELRLCSSLMTDRSLRTMGELKELRVLDLWSPHLTDDAAERLADSREFEEISVRYFYRTNDESRAKKEGDGTE
jgi:hypothetical protein